MLIAVYDAVISLFETTADLTSSKRLKVIDRLTEMFRISPKKKLLRSSRTQADCPKFAIEKPVLDENWSG